MTVAASSATSVAVPGVMKDIERLKTLFDLFAMTLDELCRIGAAYARDPEVEIDPAGAGRRHMRDAGRIVPRASTM